MDVKKKNPFLPFIFLPAQVWGQRSKILTWTAEMMIEWVFSVVISSLAVSKGCRSMAVKGLQQAQGQTPGEGGSGEEGW